MTQNTDASEAATANPKRRPFHNAAHSKGAAETAGVLQGPEPGSERPKGRHAETTGATPCGKAKLRNVLPPLSACMILK